MHPVPLLTLYNIKCRWLVGSSTAHVFWDDGSAYFTFAKRTKDSPITYDLKIVFHNGRILEIALEDFEQAIINPGSHPRVVMKSKSAGFELQIRSLKEKQTERVRTILAEVLNNRRSPGQLKNQREIPVARNVVRRSEKISTSRLTRSLFTNVNTESEDLPRKLDKPEKSRTTLKERSLHTPPAYRQRRLFKSMSERIIPTRTKKPESPLEIFKKKILKDRPAFLTKKRPNITTARTFPSKSHSFTNIGDILNKTSNDSPTIIPTWQSVNIAEEKSSPSKYRDNPERTWSPVSHLRSRVADDYFNLIDSPQMRPKNPDINMMTSPSALASKHVVKDPVMGKFTAGELHNAGFENLGNTCYMNSVLQSMLALEPFQRDLLRLSEAEMPFPEDSMVVIMTQLLLQKQSSKSIKFNLLSRLKQRIAKGHQQFSGTQQQDAHEFFVLILDVLRDEIKMLPCRSSEWSPRREIFCPVTKNFAFQMHRSVMCTKCKATVSKNEELYEFSISLGSSTEALQEIPLHVLLDGSFATENVDHACEECGHSKAHSMSTISKAARVLTICLKRYQFAGDRPTLAQKNHRRVRIDQSVSIRHHFVETDVNNNAMDHRLEGLWGSQNSSTTCSQNSITGKLHDSSYELACVISHSGDTLTSGHYVSYVKKTLGSWLCFSDNVVTDVTREDLFLMCQSSAYILFYVSSASM